MSDTTNENADVKSGDVKINTRKAIIIGAIVIGLLTASGAAAYYFTGMNNPAAPTAQTDESGQMQQITLANMKAALDVETIYPGVSIDGIDVSGKTKEEAAAMFADAASPAAADLAITLSVDGKDYVLDSSIIGVTSNLPAVIEEAYSYNRTSTKSDEAEAIAERYQTLEQLSGNPKNFDVEYETDLSGVDKAVRDILEPLETKPVNATATSFDTTKLAFVIEDYVAGKDIDIEAAIAAVKEAIEAKEYTKKITVDTVITEPEVSKSDLEALLGLVSTFTTETTNKANRNSNIDLVCKTIDGLVLQPGEYFNFNEFIGQRTSAKGYKEAVGIYGGTTRLELGGGICQTTGTLFHSVMMADLQVDERHPHTWPSDYVEKGTDATVTWGGKNFQFTNNTEYPIAIHAYYSDLHVTMEIYGRPVEDGMTIQIEGVVTGRSGPGGPLYIANPSAPIGSNSTTKGAHDHISAECYKVYYKDGVEVKRILAFTSSYPAISAEVSIGVLAADGTVCAMDPATGAVAGPAAPVVVAPPVVTAPAATTTAAPTVPTDTTAAPTVPTDTTAAPTVPTDTTTAPTLPAT